jgi:hypothetical protein
MCLLLLVAAFAPRVAFALMWILGNRVEAAFDMALWPLLGLIFAPWTAIAYTLLWSPIDEVSGGEWIIVGIAAVVDFVSLTSRFTSRPSHY